jgi:hypothetical protein
MPLKIPGWRVVGDPSWKPPNLFKLIERGFDNRLPGRAHVPTRYKTVKGQPDEVLTGSFYRNHPPDSYYDEQVSHNRLGSRIVKTNIDSVIPQPDIRTGTSVKLVRMQNLWIPAKTELSTQDQVMPFPFANWLPGLENLSPSSTSPHRAVYLQNRTGKVVFDDAGEPLVGNGEAYKHVKTFAYRDGVETHSQRFKWNHEQPNDAESVSNSWITSTKREGFRDYTKRTISLQSPNTGQVLTVGWQSDKSMINGLVSKSLHLIPETVQISLNGKPIAFTRSRNHPTTNRTHPDLYKPTNPLYFIDVKHFKATGDVLFKEGSPFALKTES